MMQMVVVVIVLGNGCGIAAPAWLASLVSDAEESAPSYLTCGVIRVWHTKWGWSTPVKGSSVNAGQGWLWMECQCFGVAALQSAAPIQTVNSQKATVQLLTSPNHFAAASQETFYRFAA